MRAASRCTGTHWQASLVGPVPQTPSSRYQLLQVPYQGCLSYCVVFTARRQCSTCEAKSLALLSSTFSLFHKDERL